MSYSQISKERWGNINRDKYEENWDRIFNHNNKKDGKKEVLTNNKKTMFTKLLEKLSGKKTTIGAVLALVITYCLTKGYIDNDLALLLNGILVVLGFTANYATARIYGKK
jgi:hypothetical protein